MFKKTDFNYNKDSTSDLILELWQHQQREKLCTSPEKTVGIKEMGGKPKL